MTYSVTDSSPSALNSRINDLNLTIEQLAALMDLPKATLSEVIEGKIEAPTRMVVILGLLNNVGKPRRKKIIDYAVSKNDWRPIPIAPHYEASCNGEIRRVTRGRGFSVPGVVLRSMFDNKGYKRVQLTIDGKQSKHHNHRLVCMAFHGMPTRSKPYACHINGDKNENKPENLYWGSPQDNADDRAKHMYLSLEKLSLKQRKKMEMMARLEHLSRR